MMGFAPVDTLASLPVRASHAFTYQYTVKETDMSHPTLTNTATIQYTFLGNPGIPVTCKDTVKTGECGGIIIEDGDPLFDPGILKGDDEDFCSLTLESLGENDTHYTLHACAAHNAAADRDGRKAIALWHMSLDILLPPSARSRSSSTPITAP